MFCKKCGSEIKNDAKFCGKCGESVDIQQIEEQSDKDLLVSKETSEKDFTLGCFIFALPRILILIGIICFFFPFITVSCAGENVKITGTDMIFGDKEIVEEAEDYSGDDESIFNWFVLLAGLCAAGALIKPKEAGSASIFLLIFRFTAKWYYKLGDSRLSELDDVIQIDFGFALWLAIILFILAAGIGIIFEGDNDSG